MVNVSPDPSTVTVSLLTVVCCPAISAGVSRPDTTWWVSMAVSCGTSAASAFSWSAGTAWNASSAGARTVTSCWLFSESTRFAAATDRTRAENTGFALSAVTTGAPAIPAKLAGPWAGTKHPGPNGWSAGGAGAVLAGATVPLPAAALAAPAPGASEVQAVSVTARTATADRAAPRARLGLITDGAPSSVGRDQFTSTRT